MTNIERENMTLHNNTVLHESARISGTYIQVFNMYIFYNCFKKSENTPDSQLLRELFSIFQAIIISPSEFLQIHLTFYGCLPTILILFAPPPPLSPRELHTAAYPPWQFLMATSKIIWYKCSDLFSCALLLTRRQKEWEGQRKERMRETGTQKEGEREWETESRERVRRV